jgi:hypothetical protein
MSAEDRKLGRVNRRNIGRVQCGISLSANTAEALQRARQRDPGLNLSAIVDNYLKVYLFDLEQWQTRQGK